MTGRFAEMIACLLLAIDASAQPASNQRNPPSTPAWEKAAREAAAAREKHDIEAALSSYRTGLRLRPGWTEGWWYLGTLLYDENRYPEARDAFRKLVKLDPKATPAVALLGLCEFQTSEYRSSFEHLVQGRLAGIPKEHPVRTVVDYHLALLMNRAAQFEGAIELLSSLAKAGNESPSVIEAFGIAGLRETALPNELNGERRALAIQVGRAFLDATFRRPGAREAFEQILERRPDERNVRYTFASYLLAIDADRALVEFQRVLDKEPDHVPTRLQLALEFLKRGQPAEALPHARKAAELAPDNFVGHNALGRALIAVGKPQEGVDALRKAALIAPDSPETRFHLASAYMRLGRKQDAARERAEYERLKEAKKIARAQ